jgi:hypothetical protein
MMRIPRGPVWAVALLLVLSALACDVNVSTARLDNVKLYQDPNRQTKTTSYAPGDTFYCILDLKNAPEDTKVKAVWSAVDASGDTQIGEYELTNGSGVLTFQVTPPEGGWAKGNYKVVLSLNGKKKNTITFKVK